MKLIFSLLAIVLIGCSAKAPRTWKMDTPPHTCSDLKQKCPGYMQGMENGDCICVMQKCSLGPKGETICSDVE